MELGSVFFITFFHTIIYLGLLSVDVCVAALPFSHCAMFHGLNVATFIYSILADLRILSFFYSEYCYHDHSWTWILQCINNSVCWVTILGIGLLDGKVYLCLILLAGTKIFSKVVVPVYNHPGTVQEFPLLHIPDYHWRSQTSHVLLVWCVWNDI